MDIQRILSETAERHPGRTAVISGSRSYTYAELRERVAALTRIIRSAGIAPGDRVAILERNTHAFLETYFAAAGAGAILVPLNTRLNRGEQAEILRDADARLLLAGDDFAETAADLARGGTPVADVVSLGAGYETALAAAAGPLEPAAIREEDVAHLYYTSGTTGRPKGVMLTHHNVCLHAARAAEELSLDANDVWGHIAPMFHLADAWATFAITLVAGRHVMLPTFDAEAALGLIERHRVTISNLVPTMLNLMAKHPHFGDFDLTSLRAILSGGAPIAPALVKRIIEGFGCEYVQTYGMTETSPYLTLSLLHEHLKALPFEERLAYQAKTGRPFAGVELRVARDDGESVAPDGEEVGEIRVRGDTVTPGYWNRPEETARAFADGWLLTGDLAVVDAEGYVDIVDRKKDMIISGGENVYSIEVENVLYRHPAVLEAAAFGVPHETLGEAVRAAVVLRDGHEMTQAEIVAFCREHLAGYKTPRSVVFLNELPKTGSGKISKRRLRERYEDRDRSA